MDLLVAAGDHAAIVRRFQLPALLRYASLHTRFSCSHLIFVSTRRAEDEAPKGGAPTLIPIKNDLDFTGAVNSSHAANRRTLKVLVTAVDTAPPAKVAPTPVPVPVPTPIVFTPKPPTTAPKPPTTAPAPTPAPTPAPPATARPTQPTPPLPTVPAFVSTPPVALPTPSAPVPHPATLSSDRIEALLKAQAASAAAAAAVRGDAPPATPTSTASTPTTPSTPVTLDPYAGTAAAPTTRRISSTTAPRWQYVIDVVPRFALPEASAGVTGPAEAKGTPSEPAADLSAADLSRGRSNPNSDDWEEVQGLGQWSALERGIYSIRPDYIRWQSPAQLLPSPADPRKMRVVALAGGQVMPDDVVADIKVSAHPPPSPASAAADLSDC